MTITSCKKYIPTPQDTKYIPEYHALTVEREDFQTLDNNLALFVDYSTCIADGMNSSFYQKMVSPLTAATKEYWSIKEGLIQKEDGSVYSLLNNVNEVNYAALDKAIEQMAERNTESVLLTDGELFTQTATKNNPNNPYMHNAFKKWILKGHDIHILAEPYIENYKGNSFNKKRFYIIFTDDRIEKNIYSRIKEIVSLENYPNVDEFHISGNYPWSLPINGVSSIPNEIFASEIKSFGDWEIQDWQVDWKNFINFISSETDSNGNTLPNGGKILSGLKVNKNAFGSYRIKDVGIRTYVINSEYNDIYNQLEQGNKVGEQNITPELINDFIIIDSNEFKNHGNIDLYFDLEKFSPGADLIGNPFNYFVIEIYIKDIENIIGNNIDIFNFDSIVNQGETNESISESLKNAVFDDEIVKMLKDKILYRIYVKSDQFNL